MYIYIYNFYNCPKMVKETMLLAFSGCRKGSEWFGNSELIAESSLNNFNNYCDQPNSLQSKVCLTRSSVVFIC